MPAWPHPAVLGWCPQLEHGTYKTKPAPINVINFVSTIIPHKRWTLKLDGGTGATSSGASEVHWIRGAETPILNGVADCPSLEVMVDAAMLRMVLAEAIGNAVKYGAADTDLAISVKYEPAAHSFRTVRDGEAGIEAAGQSGHSMTGAKGGEMSGELSISLSNQNREGVASLSDEARRRVFERGFTGASALTGDPGSSTGIGLSTVAVAAAAAKGTVALHSETKEVDGITSSFTTLAIKFPAELFSGELDNDAGSSASSTSSASSISLANILPGTHPPSTEPPYHPANGLRTPEETSPRASPINTSTPADAPLGAPGTSPTFHEPLPSYELDRLSYLLADDVSVNLKVLRAHLRVISHNAAIDCVKSGEEVLEKVMASFPSTVADVHVGGVEEAHMSDDSASLPVGYDVLVLDDDFGFGRLSGTEVVAEIKRMYTAELGVQRPLLVMCTARADRPGDPALLQQTGADLVWPKTLVGREEMRAQIAAALARHRANW